MLRDNLVYLTRTYDTAEDLTSADWDEPRPVSDLGLSSDWLRSTEGVFGCPPSYLVLHQDSRPAAGLACYRVSRDAYLYFNPPSLLVDDETVSMLSPFLSPDERSRFAELVSSLRPSLQDAYPCLVCAVPFGYVMPAWYRSERPRDEIRALLQAFDDVAKDSQARSSAFLYLPEENHEHLSEQLESRGYLPLILESRCLMPTAWSSFDDYLETFRSSRRWAIRREIRGLEESGLRVELHTADVLAEVKQDLAVMAASLAAKYGHAADVESERRAFDSIETHLAALVRILIAYDHTGPVGYHLFYEKDDVLYAGIAGRDVHRLAGGEYLYFNLVFYELIKLAIARGASSIDYGVGAQEVKVSRGCKLRPLRGYFRCESLDKGRLAELLTIESLARSRENQMYKERYGHR